MQTELEKGTIVCITPDGPRGPFERMKYGTVRIASEGKLPIIFAEIDMPASRQLKSWDRFLIPLPFSKVQVTLHTILPPHSAPKKRFGHSPKSSQTGSPMHKRPLSILLRPLGLLYG